jgi:hypothetical protein
MLEDLRAALDNAARFAAALLLGGVISLVILAPHKLWLLVPSLLFLFAWIEYRSAVSAATAYGDTLYVVFDLHRFDVIKALHYPLPANTEEEERSNMDLSEMLAKRRWSRHHMMKYIYNPEFHGRFALLQHLRRRLL